MDSVSDPDLDEWDDRIAKVLAKVLAKGLPQSKHGGVTWHASSNKWWAE